MNAKGIWLAVAALAIAFAVLVVERLDDQALALLTGAACGVTAGVPMTAVIFWITQRQKIESASAQREPPPPPPREPPSPPFIVVQPPPQAASPMPAQAWQQGYPPLPPARPERDFNIIGEDEEDEDGNS